LRLRSGTFQRPRHPADPRSPDESSAPRVELSIAVALRTDETLPSFQEQGDQSPASFHASNPPQASVVARRRCRVCADPAVGSRDRRPAPNHQRRTAIGDGDHRNTQHLHRRTDRSDELDPKQRQRHRRSQRWRWKRRGGHCDAAQRRLRTHQYHAGQRRLRREPDRRRGSALRVGPTAPESRC